MTRLLAAALAAVSILCGCGGGAPGGDGAVPASSGFGKRLAPIDLACLVENAVEEETGAIRADLVIRAAPHADMTGGTIEFALPEGWVVLAGKRVASADLKAGAPREFRVSVRVEAGAPRAAAGRVFAPAGVRESWFSLQQCDKTPAGRLDQDASGNPVRVFPAGKAGG